MDRYPKNVASTDCEFYDPAVGQGEDDELLTITVDNAYPSYYGSVLIDVHNQGSIPVKLHEIRLMSKSKGGSVIDIDSPNGMLITQCTVYYVDFEECTVSETHDLNGPDTDDFSFHVSKIDEPWGLEQIDPCELGWFDVSVHLEQGAEQGQIYDFTLKLTFCNWNEP